jgi:hypothetical protein
LELAGVDRAPQPAREPEMTNLKQTKEQVTRLSEENHQLRAHIAELEAARDHDIDDMIDDALGARLAGDIDESSGEIAVGIALEYGIRQVVSALTAAWNVPLHSEKYREFRTVVMDREIDAAARNAVCECNVSEDEFVDKARRAYRMTADVVNRVKTDDGEEAGDEANAG